MSNVVKVVIAFMDHPQINGIVIEVRSEPPIDFWIPDVVAPSLNPSEVNMPESVFRGMWVPAWHISIKMVLSVSCYPEYWPTLHGEVTTYGDESFKPLGHRESAMGKQPVVTERQAE